MWINGCILKCEGKSHNILLQSGHSIWKNHIHVHCSCIPFRLNIPRKIPLTQHSPVKQAIPKPSGVVYEAPVVNAQRNTL